MLPDYDSASAGAPRNEIEIRGEYGNGELTCPRCGFFWRIPPETLEAMILELDLWDRRFDSPRTIVESLLAILDQDLA